MCPTSFRSATGVLAVCPPVDRPRSGPPCCLIGAQQLQHEADDDDRADDVDDRTHVTSLLDGSPPSPWWLCPAPPPSAPGTRGRATPHPRTRSASPSAVCPSLSAVGATTEPPAMARGLQRSHPVEPRGWTGSGDGSSAGTPAGPARDLGDAPRGRSRRGAGLSGGPGTRPAGYRIPNPKPGGAGPGSDHGAQEHARPPGAGARARPTRERSAPLRRWAATTRPRLGARWPSVTELIRASKSDGGIGRPSPLGRLPIGHQLERRLLFDGEIGGLRALQDLVDVGRSAGLHPAVS